MSVITSLATGLQTGAHAIAPALATTDNPVADFSDTPWWLSLVKALFVFAFLMVNTLLVIWFERRVIGRMQQRPGSNRTGPFGLLQTLADGVKLALKEDLTPKNADKIVFILAPIIAGAMAFVSFAIIPLGPMVSMFGHRTPLQLTGTPIAVLLVWPWPAFMASSWRAGHPVPRTHCWVDCAPPHRSSPTRSRWVCAPRGSTRLRAARPRRCPASACASRACSAPRHRPTLTTQN